MRKLLARAKQLAAKTTAKATTRRDFGRWRNDPVGYCRDVLAVDLTPAQAQIATAVITPPYRVLAPAAHNVGKSFIAACLVCWWYDTRPNGVCLTTAPTERQVKDILWKEVRKLRTRARLGGFAGPKIPRLQSAPGHFAHGFTARDADSFQGQHEVEVFIVFDEAEGVDSLFWEAAQTMLGPTSPFLAIYNPIRQDSQAYIEETTADYQLVHISAIDHPNIGAELNGQSPPFPSAIRLARLRELLRKWATPLAPGTEPKPTDIRLEGQWYRPGPIAECRILGRRPTTAVNAVWSDFAWMTAESMLLPSGGQAQIGVDVARFGDDFTALHVRQGGNSLHHESHNGLSIDQTIERCKSLATETAKQLSIVPTDVLLVIDDSGVGGGVTDGLRAGGWTCVGLNASSTSPDPDYPNMRSAMWFGLSEAASTSCLSFARLPAEVRSTMRREFVSVTYTLDMRGRRVVEPKEVTKRRIKRSPDNADATMLAYANVVVAPDRVGGRIRAP